MGRETPASTRVRKRMPVRVRGGVVTEPDMDTWQRITRATCAELHRRDLEIGYLVRPLKDPGRYRSDVVAGIIHAALAAGVIQEVSDG